MCICFYRLSLIMSTNVDGSTLESGILQSVIYFGNGVTTCMSYREYFR